MSSEAPLPAETEPRSITNLNGNPILVDFEQKVAALETKRLEGLDRAIILEEKLSGLEAKVLALEKEKEEAIAFSKAKAAEFDQVSSKLRELEKRNSSNPEPLVAASKQDADQAPKSDERIAELEAKNKTLEQKILKNNAQKQAFAEQFDKLEEQLAQSQVQSKILLEKIAYLEGSGTREQYSRLEQQFKELEAEKTAAVERIKLLESTGQSPESLASLIAKVEQLEKANIAEIEKSAGLEEKLTTSAASFQSQIQELKAQNEDLQKLKVLEKQLADEKSVSKSLQETLAYTFDSDIKDKEAQAQKVAKLNEELKIARETATAEKELAIQLNEKLLSAEKEALAASNIEQQLHKVTEQLQLSETRVMLQIEKSVTEKKTLIALFDEEKAVLNKKLDEIGERLKVAEDTLQIEREKYAANAAADPIISSVGSSGKPAESAVSALESEVANLKSQLSSSNTDREVLINKLSTAEAKVSELTNEVEEYDAEKAHFQDDIKLLDHKIAKYESKLYNYENKVSELSTKNYTSMENLRSLETNTGAEKSSLEQKLNSIENEKKAALTKVAELEKKLVALETPMASKKFLEDNGEVKPSVSTIKNALQQKVAENASPKSRYKGLARKVTKIENRFAEDGLRPTHQSSASEDHHIKQNSEDTQDLANDLAKKVAQLQTERKIALDKIQVMEQKLGYSESKMLAMGHKMTETEAQRSIALEKIQELEKKTEELQGQSRKLQSNSGISNASQTLVSDKSIELQNLIQDLNAQLAAKSKEFDLEKEQFAKSQETNAQLIKVLEQRNAYLDSQLSGSQISTNIAITGHPNNRVTELETNIAKLQSEKSEISSKLAELDSKAQEWETKRDDYVRELNSLKEQVSALQGERLAAIQRADQLQSTITEAENFRKQILNEYQVVEGSVMELKSAKLQLDGKVKRLLSVK